MLKILKKGLSFGALTDFQKKSGLPWPVICRVLRLPRRTLARRKASGRLASQESERLIRLADLYKQSVNLFEGNISGAINWLQSPNKALGQVSPLTLMESELGARAVEDLIGRLEYGVYS